MLIVFIIKLFSGLGYCLGPTEAWGFGMNGRKDTKNYPFFICALAFDEDWKRRGCRLSEQE
jgi:hypothetical protein